MSPPAWGSSVRGGARWALREEEEPAAAQLVEGQAFRAEGVARTKPPCGRAGSGAACAGSQLTPEGEPRVCIRSGRTGWGIWRNLRCCCCHKRCSLLFGETRYTHMT